MHALALLALMTRLYLQNGGYWIDTSEAVPSPLVMPVNILGLGALGDGIANDTPAFVTGLNTLADRGGGVLYLKRPTVAYILEPPGYSYSAAFPFSTPALVIPSNVRIVGDQGGSLIRMRTPGGGSPATDFKLVPLWATDVAVPVPPAAWQASHAYVGGNVVVGPNGHGYRCTIAGTSGSTGPLDLSPATARAIVDGSVTWELADSVYKGPMFRIKAGSGNIQFQNIILDGGAPREASSALPPLSLPPYALAFDTPANGILAGHGWVLGGHQAVVLGPEAGGQTIGDVTFEDCEFRNWRSECLYGSFGNGNVGKVTLNRPRFISCTGSQISIAGPVEVNDGYWEDCDQPVENDGSIFDQTFRRPTVKNCNTGFIFVSQTASYTARGRTIVEDLIVDGVLNWAVRVAGYVTNLWVSRSKLIDAGQTGGTAVISTDNLNRNVHFIDPEIICNRKSIGICLALAPGDPLELTRCKIIRTPLAISLGQGIFLTHVCTTVAGGFILATDCDFSGALNVTLGDVGGPGQALFRNARWDGIFSHVAPTLDVRFADHYELTPPGPTSFSAPSHFPVGVETMVAINSSVTIIHGVGSIELAGAVNITPASSVGKVWLIRHTLASERVVETRRVPA